MIDNFSQCFGILITPTETPFAYLFISVQTVSSYIQDCLVLDRPELTNTQKQLMRFN